jgi:hypothetical protein
VPEQPRHVVEELQREHAHLMNVHYELLAVLTRQNATLLALEKRLVALEGQADPNIGA